MSTALIVNAIRNMFGRKPKPKPRRTLDGQMGPWTRVVIAKHKALPYMPKVIPFYFWDVTTSGRGTFRVQLVEHATGGPRLVTSLAAPMAKLSPETIVAMSRTIMRATGGKR